ncbi:MAG: hypothetical protein J6U20_09960 [Fibrobacter sp.]|nr:hypothetical protein [Fibrobacter sp.]
MARQNENFLDRVMRYGGVQRRPQYAPRNNGGFVPRGGYGSIPQGYGQQRQAQPQPQPVQRQYTPEEIYAYRMEQAKREYAQRAYEAEMQRRAAYGVPQVGDGAAARPYEFLMGEAARLGASSGAMPAGGAQVPQGYAQQPEPEEQPLTEEEEAQLRIRLMYNDYTREAAERGAQPASFEEFVQALVARSQAQQQQAAEPQAVQQPEAQPAEVPQVATAEPTTPMPQA